MRNTLRSILCLCLFIPLLGVGQEVLTGTAADRVIPGAVLVRTSNSSGIPSFVRFNQTNQPDFAGFQEWGKSLLRLSADDGFFLKSTENDNLGFTHFRYGQTYKGHPVEGAMWIVHTLNGKVVSMNGELYSGVASPVTPVLSESQALTRALSFIGADVYKWQLPQEEKFIKWEQSDPNATFFPIGSVVLAPVDGNFKQPRFVAAWKFSIYAQSPLSNSEVFVDARNGQIVWQRNRLMHVDSAGTAVTGYSGTQPIKADFTGTTFRLREVGRGLGVETYDMNTGTSYGAAVDFTDSDNNWNNVNTQKDQYATDAHWGAEKTYDYFWQEQGRNSINGSGFRLRSYVHYDVNYSNAFWDGTRMTYGDGSTRPFTALDVAGHEITHGLTTFTADLVYQDEPGALNESFSDIFGNTIERLYRPLQWNWRIGEDLYNNGIRNMQNPGALGDPDTYLGTNWYTGTGDNGGVHTNSSVQNKWFYILTQGENGTNDLGDAYSVSGIGIDKASDIAYRNLVVYLTTNSQYADARFYAIQSALDLYGPCTNEVTQTTNAWYAVGVGSQFNPTGTPNFIASSTTTCTGTVYFSDQSTSSGLAWSWNFGDGQTATGQNPAHTYAANGTYSVTMVITTCNGQDTVVRNSYVTVAKPAGPSSAGASRCGPGPLTLTATGSGNVKWYANPTGGSPLATGNSFTTPSLSTTTTYYAELESPQPSAYVGPVNNSSVGAGGYHNNTSTQYLEFTVLSPIKLVSVWKNAAASGTRTISIWDNGGTLVWDTTMNIPNGNGRITLNRSLAPGSYRIGGSQMNLYRNNSGPNYPYSLAGKVNITGSSAGPSFYYYFYDWEIAGDPCLSERTPVIAQIATASAGITPSGPTTICPGGSVVLTADPNASYQWSNGATSQSITVTSAGTYTVSVTNGSGCNGVSSPLTVVVTSSPTPTISASGSTSLCPGSNVQLSASSGSSYLWSNGSTAQNITVSSAGNYTVTVTYPGGCSGSATSNITVASAPTASINSSVGTSLCNNSSATLVAGGGTSYSWSNGASTSSISVSAAGTYVVTVTNANGCTDTETITLTSIAAPNATITTPSNTFCQGGTTVLTAGGGGTYNWSTGASTSAIMISSGGNYSVTVTGANGCTDVETIAMSQVTPPTSSFSWSPSMLTVSFSNTSGGTSGFCTYIWDFGDGGTSGSQFPTHTYSSDGIYTVNLIVDCQGCRDTSTQVIEVFTTGLEDVLSNAQLSIYPNPFSGNLNFDLSFPSSGNLTITFHDALGREVSRIYSGQITAGAFRREWLAPNELSGGVYFARIKMDEAVVQKKLILNR